MADLATAAHMAFQNATEALASFLAPMAGNANLLGRLDGRFVLESILIVVIVGLMFQKSYSPQRPLTEKEIDLLCDEWVPEPLHPPASKGSLEYEPPVFESAAGPRAVVNGREVLNLAPTNLLGLTGNAHINDAATAALRKYGVGSCGPRGFYGTIDVHMDLEEKLAKFMGVDDCILYSYGLATAASTLPAFCKRGDIIIADEGLNWAVQNGLNLSRSTVKLFRHNDMADLEARLKEVVAGDWKEKKVLNRRFIVVEGIYQNSGQMAPLDEIVRLKEKYFFRVLVDESLTFGVLGKAGRGLAEHYGVPVKKVDVIVAGMGNAIASVGGFCCGDAHMVDHQRLSGLGYCFSASLPPFLASAAIAAIDEMEDHPELRDQLHANVTAFRKAVSGIAEFRMSGDEKSPVVMLYLKTSTSTSRDTIQLQRVADRMLEENVLVSVTRRSPLDRCRLPVGLRIIVSAGHEPRDLQSAAETLKRVAKEALQ